MRMGTGLVLVAKKLDLFKPPFFVVDSYYEALIIKNEGIQSDVLVIGYTDPENIFRAKKGELYLLSQHSHS
jgi:alanine racemase